MRMIVHAIEEVLDNGLQKEGQVVVSKIVRGTFPLLTTPVSSTAHE